MSQFETEVVFHQGHPREQWDEGIFATMGDAVEHIQSVISGHGDLARAWINNSEVQLRNGRVCCADGTPIAGNAKWEEALNPHYKAARGIESRIREANMAVAVEMGIL